MASEQNKEFLSIVDLPANGRISQLENDFHLVKPGSFQQCSSEILPNLGPRKTRKKTLKPDYSKTSVVSTPAKITTSSVISQPQALEMQFIGKYKRYQYVKEELLAKQEAFVHLYGSLLGIQHRLQKFGKIVRLEEVKLVAYSNNQCNEPINNILKTRLEEIPNMMIKVCSNLLERHRVLIQLLEAIGINQVDFKSNEIQTFKDDTLILHKNFDNVFENCRSRLETIVSCWQEYISDGIIQQRWEEKESLVRDSYKTIEELKKTLEYKKGSYNKSLETLKTSVNNLKEEVRILEEKLELERKSGADAKTRHVSNARSIKGFHSKLLQLEKNKLESENVNENLWQKLKLLQDQLKLKESLWQKERENLEEALQLNETKLGTLHLDTAKVEIALGSVAKEKIGLQNQLQARVEEIQHKLFLTKEEVTRVKLQQKELLEKCSFFHDYATRMGLDKKSNNKTLRIKELESRVWQLEEDKLVQLERRKLQLANQNKGPSETEKKLAKQADCLVKYRILLEESERKLQDKSMEVANMLEDIRELRERQEKLEAQLHTCPTDALQLIVEEGQQKLGSLICKCIYNEQQLDNCAVIVRKQTTQMEELEKLLRYKENTTGIMRASRDELLLEKDSLTRYSKELRASLAVITVEDQRKTEVLKEYQNKLEVRKQQLERLRNEIEGLRRHLFVAVEKRHMLEETLLIMEKELDSSKRKLTCDSKTRNKFPTN